MQIPVYNLKGEVARHTEIDDDVFGIPFNAAVVHQAMLRQLANRRQGTAATKTRGKVKGSTIKLYRQKGTGRARRGNIKSPLMRGGGIVFGPLPRSYRQAMPKKMRRLALKCLLSSKVREENMKVVEELDFEKPGTKEVLDILLALSIDSSVLILTTQPQANLVKSTRNLSGVKVLPSALISVLDLLSYEVLLVTVSALANMEQIWGRRTVENASL